MKLNLGCGSDLREGFINADVLPGSDVQTDLERFPWPWETDSISEILLNHTLEHLGKDHKVFCKIFQEMYRVCKDEAHIYIAVPHPRHDDFISDPTHVRMITPVTLNMFNKQANDTWKERKLSNLCLAHILNIDIQPVKIEVLMDEPYQSDYNAGKIEPEEMEKMVRERNNIAKEYRFILQVHKKD